MTVPLKSWLLFPADAGRVEGASQMAITRAGFPLGERQTGLAFQCDVILALLSRVVELHMTVRPVIGECRQSVAAIVLWRKTGIWNEALISDADKLRVLLKK